MKLGLHTTRSSANFGNWGAAPEPNVETVRYAESLGYDSVWTAEAAGTDAVTPLAFLAAHTSTIKLGTDVLQVAARTPATTAMTAVTLDILSRGRVILGLGVSGPASVEDWHGMPYGKPLVRTREYVQIVRDVLTRRPVDRHGTYYDVPYRGPDATDVVGQPMQPMQPMRLMIRPPRPRIPIYLAAIGPKNTALANEIADGCMPAMFSPTQQEILYPQELATRRASNGLPPLEIAPCVYVVVGGDVDACRAKVRPTMAFWLGAMGSGGVNYYNRLACRLGYEGPARKIMELYAEGRYSEAASVVPDELIDEVALCGPRSRIAELLEPWKASAVTTMILMGATKDAIALMAELVL